MDDYKKFEKQRIFDSAFKVLEECPEDMEYLKNFEGHLLFTNDDRITEIVNKIAYRYPAHTTASLQEIIIKLKDFLTVID